MMSQPAGADRTIAAYAEAIASGEPTPGGGSVVATTAAFAGGLGEMVARLTLGRTQDVVATEYLRDTLSNLTRLRHSLLSLATADERAYAAYRGALALPKDTPEAQADRRAAIERALHESAQVPLAVAQACADLLTALITVGRFGTTPYRRADGGVPCRCGPSRRLAVRSGQRESLAQPHTCRRACGSRNPMPGAGPGRICRRPGSYRGAPGGAGSPQSFVTVWLGTTLVLRQSKRALSEVEGVRSLAPLGMPARAGSLSSPAPEHQDCQAATEVSSKDRWSGRCRPCASHLARNSSAACRPAW